MMTPAPRNLDKTARAAADSVPLLRSAVAGYALGVGAPETVVEDLRLAVSEALTNVVMHAYPEDDPEPRMMRLTAEVEDDVLHVVVTDEGRGMVPRLDSPGLGLGLSLMAHAASSLTVDAGPGGGTAVRMGFRLAN